MGELDSYKPYDYPRLCDVCGNRRRISVMQKMPGGVWVCDIHKDERTAVELSRLKPKSYNIVPVPDAKPESPYPDVMEAEEAVIMDFVQRMVTAGTRYEQVISGQHAPMSGHMIEGLSWSARYLYTIITDTRTSAAVLAHAKAMLLSIATQLRARQQGFGLSPSSTRATDAFYGGFFESGGTYWYSDDTATAGLALLYAYRVFGTLTYRDSARAAASYLRNAQAIGKYGTHFTSTDAAGANRLYTGAITNLVANVVGFYSDHRFYPSSLIALQFWKELKTTDGDQSIGATAAVTGFDSAPAQLLSTSMTELRDFWTNGVLDSAGETYSGLSATTPREYFNAYPNSKTNVTVAGTGRWEYVDGGASTGTTVSSLNFAKALEALYAYEGASGQVTAIDDWLRSFTSNSSFETPDNTSARTLARSTTGDYDSTLCLSTLLLVRDSANSYASIALNGSSLYDWGVFGLLSPLWATRHGGTFPAARQSVFGKKERFVDGARSDGDYVDWITMRGESGLTYQTAFSVDASGSPSDLNGQTVVTPPRVGLAMWVGGAGSTITTGLDSGGSVRVTGWSNLTYPTNGHLFAQLSGLGDGPYAGYDTLDGRPSVSWRGWPDVDTTQYMNVDNLAGTHVSTAMKATDGTVFGYGVGEHQARTLVAVIRPRLFINPFDGNICGGVVSAWSSSPYFMTIFQLDSTILANAFFVASTQFDWRSSIGTAAVVQGPYDQVNRYIDVPLIAEWSTSGGTDINFYINGVAVPIAPTALSGGGLGGSEWTLGNRTPGDRISRYKGTVTEFLIYDYKLEANPTARAQAYQYLIGRYPSIEAIGMTNDVARSSMFGVALHQNPVAPVIPS